MRDAPGSCSSHLECWADPMYEGIGPKSHSDVSAASFRYTNLLNYDNVLIFERRSFILDRFAPFTSVLC